ncbi:MAG: phosphopantothenoylcysteine decarboxylase, partial [Chloroflexota bacterium]
HVGFALEAQNLLESARSKLRLNGQDLVVANAISPENNPFGANANQVAFVTASGETQLPLLAKRDVAERLLDAVVVLMREKQQPEYEA